MSDKIDGLELCEKFPDDFTQITICIHKEVLRDMRNTIGIRKISDSMYGITDAFIGKLLDGIGDGEAGMEFIKKADREKYINGDK